MTKNTDVLENTIIEVYDISKIGAHTVRLLSLEGVKQFRFIDNEKILHSDVGFEYSQKQVGQLRKNVLNIFKKVSRQKSKIAIVFDYLTINIQRILELKASKTPFIYCLITKKYSYIIFFTSNNPCIECFCLNEKIIPELSKHTSYKIEISKLQYGINNTIVSIIAGIVSNNIFKIINAINEIKTDQIIKIDNNNLEIEKMHVKKNKKCGILLSKKL